MKLIHPSSPKEILVAPHGSAHSHTTSYVKPLEAPLVLSICLTMIYIRVYSRYKNHQKP